MVYLATILSRREKLEDATSSPAKYVFIRIKIYEEHKCMKQYYKKTINISFIQSIFFPTEPWY